MNPLVVIAIFVSIRWTQPATSTNCEAQRGRAGIPWAATTLYSLPLAGAGRVTAVPAGQTALAYVSVTQNPQSTYGVASGGQAIRVRYRSTTGAWSQWSNYVVIAADLTSDSLYSDTGNNWAYAPASRVLKWSRSSGDTALARISATGPVLPAAELCKLGKR